MYGRKKSPLRCTCSPSAYKSLQLPAFHSSSFYLGSCPRWWCCQWGGGTGRKQPSSLKIPSSKQKGQQECHCVPEEDSSLPPHKWSCIGPGLIHWESSSQGKAGTGQILLFSWACTIYSSVLYVQTSSTLGDAATLGLAGPAQGGGAEQPLGTSPVWEGTRGQGRRSMHGPVPSPPEEKETDRDRQLRDRQETGTRSAQMQEPRSQLQTKVVRWEVLNSRMSKGFIGRAPSGK